MGRFLASIACAVSEYTKDQENLFASGRGWYMNQLLMPAVRHVCRSAELH